MISQGHSDQMLITNSTDCRTIHLNITFFTHVHYKSGLCCATDWLGVVVPRQTQAGNPSPFPGLLQCFFIYDEWLHGRFESCRFSITKESGRGQKSCKGKRR
ncbi:hypothetical protein GDO81_019518 [Engystomops pustulosus]|uniref:Uncharacterized protein n=1 Tax=Engystomops pustulosus TaxID=76066 RepID=A0AAV6YC89_ENGPU|nr:hypothetical protein GDO81_019518 [Engystomops pustulosus]